MDLKLKRKNDNTQRLMAAVKAGNTRRVVRIITDHTADPIDVEDIEIAVKYACRHGNVETIELLGFEHTFGYDCLYVVCTHGHYKLAEFIITRMKKCPFYTDLDINDILADVIANMCLCSIRKRYMMDITMLLIRHGARDLFAATLYACKSKNYPLVKMLLENAESLYNENEDNYVTDYFKDYAVAELLNIGTARNLLSEKTYKIEQMRESAQIEAKKQLDVHIGTGDIVNIVTEYIPYTVMFE